MRVHAGNPRYFDFRGKATTLVSSGEHYGSLLNLDFDFEKYFDRLAANNLTMTIAFVGSYVEPGRLQTC